MKRNVENDSIKRLKLSRLLDKTESVRQRLVRWAEDNGDALSTVTPRVPKEVKSDRARDNARPLLTPEFASDEIGFSAQDRQAPSRWTRSPFPLSRSLGLAIATVAGGDWPERVSEAVVALSSMAEQEVEGDVAEVLLKDLARIFRVRKARRIDTQVILRKLARREARLWPTYSHGHPITREQLARLLKPFGVKPVKWADKSRPRKFHRGYTLTDLRETFARYAGWTPPHSPHPPQKK
jgi:hypothetical protein